MKNKQPHNNHYELTDDFENKLTKAIEKGIINALKAFGADMDNQQEVQKDFHFLRYLRKRSETSSHLIMKPIISISIASGAVALWEGVKIMHLI